MWRYFAIATAIVVVAIATIVALPQREAPREPSTQRYTTGHGTPGPPGGDTLGRAPLPVTGAAPWALSALPECFRQQSRASGPAWFARRKVPAGAKRVAGGVSLHVGDCRLDIGDDSVAVTRGENRLSIPPEARIYVAGRALVLERVERGREDVRVYTLVGGAAPSFAPAKPH